MVIPEVLDEAALQPFKGLAEKTIRKLDLGTFAGMKPPARSEFRSSWSELGSKGSKFALTIDRRVIDVRTTTARGCVCFVGYRVSTEVRRNVPKGFIVGVKLNSADFGNRKAVAMSGESVLQYVREITSWRFIDFLEITEFAASVSERRVFFSQFSRRVHEPLP
ncbi:hypothetical protein BDM02DRAFT_3129881 [Thelephora ganbajun]|uniref:Uncharacterized protein n=1 Tax=Thelephora ganbajun TaxID=370292 RepID=A0ACB6ZCX3_THEGA|nr:hypothetical protein BDM02DRAFT_3129881 [Thelephora ganbajun]